MISTEWVCPSAVAPACCKPERCCQMAQYFKESPQFLMSSLLVAKILVTNQFTKNTRCKILLSCWFSPLISDHSQCLVMELPPPHGSIAKLQDGFSDNRSIFSQCGGRQNGNGESNNSELCCLRSRGEVKKGRMEWRQLMLNFASVLV